MVVVHRTRSSSHIETIEQGKFSLPYGDDQLIDRSSSCGSIASQRQRSRLEDEVHGGGVSKTPSRSNVQTGGPLSVVTVLTKILIFLAICYSIHSTRTALSKRDSEMEELRNELAHVENALSQSESKVDKADISLENLRTELVKLLPGGEDHHLAEGDDEVLYQKITDRQMAMKVRVRELQSTISILHRGQAMEHFGLHRYRVMFNLRIDEGIYSFIVELAPIELMPHSVHFFMQMVNLHAWDDTIFSHRQKHVLLAELRNSDGKDKSGFLRDRGLTTLSFPEYSRDYPHVKYTLGFSGRPGGPGFYINTADNREVHGPGGQSAHHLDEEADACFGTVTEGNNVIDWMTQRHEMIPNSFTTIDSVRIISDET